MSDHMKLIVAEKEKLEKKVAKLEGQLTETRVKLRKVTKLYIEGDRNI